MNADEPGVWLEKIELDVPAVPPDQVHVDRCHGVVGAAAVMGAVAGEDHVDDLRRRYRSRRQQVLHLDIAA